MRPNKNSKKTISDETKVVLAVIVAIVLLELMIRNVAVFFSGNIKHIQSIPSITENLFTEEPEKTPILFIGNSLTYNGIDLPTFEHELNYLSQSNIKAAKITPDDTGIWEWYFIYRNHFYKNNRAPKILIVGFAWGLLNDQTKINPSRLAGFFCNFGDLPNLVKLGMTDNSKVAQFFIGSLSQSYVNREAIHKRTLALFIPYYRNVTQQLNEFSKNRKATKKNQQLHFKYQVLSQWMKLLKEQNVSVVFVSMPLVNPYVLDKKLAHIIKQAGMQLFDYRYLTGITPEMFLDSMHLNKQGSTILTKSLAQDISKLNL